MSEKNKVRLCFEAQLIDEDGSPYNIGLEMTIGDASKELSSKEYAELTSGINFIEVLKSFSLYGIVDPTDIWVITPEEYDEKYEKEGEDEVS